MSQPKIIITATDRQRLEFLLTSAFSEAIDSRSHLDALRTELRRATIVDSEDVPDDVITMNSTVCLYDIDYDVTDTYTLVYPRDADILDNKVSILAPIGTAILGSRVGATVVWQSSTGRRYVQVKELLFQPERAGVLS
jgi:regulator of nucleoside diphosphate kinase